MTWPRRVAPILAATCLVWCVLVGLVIWFTPMHYVSTSQGASTVIDRRFSEVSGYGALPLVIPILIAGLGAWGAWRGRRAVLGVAATLLTVFAIITGFSIGAAYVPAAGLLLIASGLAVFLGSGRPKPEAVA